MDKQRFKPGDVVRLKGCRKEITVKRAENGGAITGIYYNEKTGRFHRVLLVSDCVDPADLVTEAAHRVVDRCASAAAEMAGEWYFDSEKHNAADGVKDSILGLKASVDWTKM